MLYVTIYIDSEFEVVTQHILDPEHRKKWWPELSFDPYPGAQLVETWIDASGKKQIAFGTIMHISRDGSPLLRFRWADDGVHYSIVTWELTEENDRLSNAEVRENSLKITVHETGLESYAVENAQYQTQVDLIAEREAGWNYHLNNLKRTIQVKE